MTAAAALFPMAALAPGSGSCFSGNNNNGVNSRRSSKEPHLVQQLESPSTEGSLGDPHQQWQEVPLGGDVSDGQQQQQQSAEFRGPSSAAAAPASVTPLRAYPVKTGPQKPAEIMHRGLSASPSPVRPSLTAKTSSLLQRKQQFYKTKMCPWFSRGRCDRGGSCQFAHSDSELRATPDLRRTSLCPRLKQLGRCVNRDCSYAHQPQELRATGEVYKTALCVKWQLGRCAVGNLCRHAHGPEEMRSAGISTGASPKKGAPDSHGAAATVAPPIASSAASSGLGRLEKTGGAALETPDGDRSSRSSLGSSTGNVSSSGNSTCTSSPAPCPSPYSFSGTAAAAVAEAVGKAGKGKGSHEMTSAEVLPVLDRETQQTAVRQQQSDHQERLQEQHPSSSSLEESMGTQGASGAPWMPEVGALCPDYPLPPQNLGGWDQQQQGRFVVQHAKGMLQQRHSSSPQRSALWPLTRKLPKAIQRQLRQQQHPQQQALVLQPLRQGRFNYKDVQPQQQITQLQLQAVQGGHRRRPSQQQQLQQQPQQHHQPQPQQPLYQWMPRHQRLPWSGVQQQQRHQLLQQPLPGNLQHFQAQQHHLPPNQMLLLQHQQQQPANLSLREALWQHQDQQHPQHLTQGHPPFEHALSQDPSNPLGQPLQRQQQQQAKTSPYGAELAQQQLREHHTWESQGLLALWEQPDLCCWTSNTESQRPENDTAAAAACAAAPFVAHSIDDRLLLLQQQDIQVLDTSGLPQHQGQHTAAVEPGADASGAGDAATAVAAGGGTQLLHGDAPVAAGAPRPVPLQVPDSAQLSQMSQESPCSILFSGPKLFNVAADGGDQQD